MITNKIISEMNLNKYQFHDLLSKYTITVIQTDIKHILSAIERKEWKFHDIKTIMRKQHSIQLL